VGVFYCGAVFAHDLQVPCGSLSQHARGLPVSEN
jgi:hypothetical protein